MASHDGMTRAELIELINDMRDDWATFNRILNTQATAFGWCGEYEERMEQYNTETKVLKMQGRVPKGKSVSTRNAYAARRLIMGHAMTTFQRLGMDPPEDGLDGRVASDHRALAKSHDTLVAQLFKQPSKHEEPQ